VGNVSSIQLLNKEAAAQKAIVVRYLFFIFTLFFKLELNTYTS